MSERGYQLEFSRDNPAMHSQDGRRRKAATMLAVLQREFGERLATARALNVGCSTGIIDDFLAPHVGQMIGIDIDEPAILGARATYARPNLEFRVGDAMALDFPDGSIDIVVCSQVYEHVPDPARMMAEIHRVLAPGGVCYFAATSRLCIVEKHYGLPFLSIMPVWLAHIYLRVTGKGRYYHERHYTMWGLRRLTRAFDVDDCTRNMLRDPAAYGIDYMVGSGWRLFAARSLAAVAYWAFPGYIWLLRRRRDA